MQPHSLQVNKGSLKSLDKQFLLDCIKLKSKPKTMFYFGFLACITESGVPFIFYHDKNRYINISVNAAATQIVHIDQREGQLAISLKNNQIAIVSCMNGRHLKTLKHEHHILNMHVNHSKGLLMSCSQDAVIMHNFQFDKQHSLFARNSPFVSACFMSSSSELATLFQDKSLSIWSLNSWEVLWRVQLNDQVKPALMLPSLDGHRLIIGTSTRIHIVEESVIEQVIQPGYGGGVIQIKSMAKSKLFLLTKNHQLIQVDSVGNVLATLELPLGKTPIHFDIYNQNIAVATNTGEILIYDLRHLVKQQHSKLGAQQESIIKENYPDTLNLDQTASNLQIRKVGQTNESKVHNTTISGQSTLKSKNYNTITLQRSMKNTQDPLKELLGYNKLEQYLKQYKVFPDDKRALSWRSLLNLPMNEEAYSNLCQQGIHRAYQRLSETYPIQSESMFSRLQRTLSNLAHYCPLFAEVDYLPQLVFPFVKLFKRGQELLLFEITLSILMQLCQRFFENFPTAPVSLLLFHDQVLQNTSSELSAHLKNVGYQSVKHMWPSMRCLMTDLLSKEQWLILMDHLILYNDIPQLVPLFMIAYLQYFKPTLMRVTTLDQLDQFFTRQNPIDIHQVIQNTIALANQLDYNSYVTTFSNYLPLEKNQYQIFNVYPEKSVAYQARIREGLSQEANMLRQKQHQISKLKEMQLQLQDLDKLFQEKQQLTLQVEKDRQEMFDYQTEMRAQKAFSTEQQLREQRVNQLKVIEAQMKNSLQEQVSQQSKEQVHLNEQFKKTINADNLRIQSIQEEEQLQNMEFQLFQKFTAFMEQRSKQEHHRKIQAELEFNQKQKEIADLIKTEQWKSESQEQQLKREAIKQQKLSELQQLADQNRQDEMIYQQMIHQFQQDLQLIQLERERRLRDMVQQDQFQKETRKLDRSAEEKRRSMSYQRKAQIEQEMNEIARQHQIKLQQQEQQMLEQLQSHDIYDESSKDVRIPMTSQKSYGISSEKKSMQSPSLVEDEREKFSQFRQQLREEINSLKEKEHDDKLQKLLKDREQEIFKRTQQIREQINQENMPYHTGQFQKQASYSPNSSSQFSLYQPQHQVDIDPNMSESQLTYSSGFTSPGQRY